MPDDDKYPLAIVERRPTRPDCETPTKGRLELSKHCLEQRPGRLQVRLRFGLRLETKTKQG
jgi:hypothetical protein